MLYRNQLVLRTSKLLITRRMAATYVVGILLMAVYTLDVPYISITFRNSAILKAIAYVIAIIILIPKFIKLRIWKSPYLAVLTAFIGYIILISIYNQCSMTLVMSTCARIVLFAVFSYACEYHDLLCIMRIWARWLLILVLIDLGTIWLFPNGMYVTRHMYSIYTQNWFLGYKTARIPYALPMIMLFAIEHELRYEKKTIPFAIVTGIALLDTYLSDGSTAFVGIALFVFLTTLLMKSRPGTIARRTLNVLSNKWLVLVIIFISWAVTILQQNNQSLLVILTSFFNKSASVSGRTIVWRRTLDAVRSSGWYGIGIVNVDTMQLITNGLDNAHNQLLTVLLNGGIPLAILYIATIVLPMIGLGSSSIEKILLYFVYANLIIGMVSSTITYASMLFFSLALMERTKLYEQATG